MNIHDVQRGLSLSSPSVAQYHLRKLIQAGLIKEEDEGYLVDRVVFENMIRIRRTVIPFQIGYVAFFATLLVFLFAFLGKSGGATGTLFYYALFVTFSALILFAYEAVKSIRSHSI
jgi:DNA-binding transcriptional ArsR family regulator